MSNDLIKFWLNQCNKRDKANALLKKYQYHHDWIKQGELGGLHARVNNKYFEPDENGKFYIAQAIWHDTPSARNYVEKPLLFDIIAWHPDNPRKWYSYCGETGLYLGEKAHFEASIHKEPLTLHSTPLAWLRSGCKGCALLDHHGLNRLYGLQEVICEDVAHGTRVEQGLSLYYKRNMPRISVASQVGV